MSTDAIIYWIIFVISLLLNLSGLISLFLVFFPGLTIVWLGQLVWAIYSGFNHSHQPWQFGLTVGIFMINTVIMIVGGLIDNVLMARNTLARKIPWWEVGLAWLCMVIGGIVVTPLGGLALSLLLLYLLEYYRSGKDSKEAVESTKGWVVGWGTAAIVRLGMAGVMVVLWLGVVFLL